MPQIRLAVGQTPVSSDVQKNGKLIRDQMREAAHRGARIIQLPELAASGYPEKRKNLWANFEWSLLKSELESIACLARALKLWVVLGSAHRLTEPNRPHNSLYIISDEGALVHRYDKQYLSHSELNGWFSPGVAPLTFQVNGIRFGCAVCIELRFPELFQRYEELQTDAVLVSSFSDSANDEVLARALASFYNLWVSLAVPTNGTLTSSVSGPDGDVLVRGALGTSSVLLVDIDRDDPQWDVPLKKARPWRTKARLGHIYTEVRVDDPRSQNKSLF